MAHNVSYEQSKQVAESSRETEWKQPSFGRELFLGNFRPDLIHPQPELDPEMVERGEAFLARLRGVPGRARSIRWRSSATRGSPSASIDGLKELGALGMKIPRGVRRPRPQPGLLQPRARDGRNLARRRSRRCCRAHQSIGLPQPLRMFGTEEQKREWLPKVASTHVSAFLLTEPDVGSDPARMSATAAPTDDGTGYTHQRRPSCGRPTASIADVVVVMAVVPKTDDAQGRHHRLHLPLRRRRHRGRAPQRVHGPARHRELA